MKVLKSINSDSEHYVLALNRDDFLHLYGVLCSILYEDNSDKFLVDLESKMIDLL